MWLVCYLSPKSASTCRKIWLSCLRQETELWLFVPASLCLPGRGARLSMSTCYSKLPKCVAAVHMCMPMSHLVAPMTVVPQLGGHVDVFALDEAFLQ